MTKTEAELRIAELQDKYYAIEQEIVALALEHNLDVYLEGCGRLLLETDSWTGKTRGEWYTSTDSCS